MAKPTKKPPDYPPLPAGGWELLRGCAVPAGGGGDPLPGMWVYSGGAVWRVVETVGDWWIVDVNQCLPVAEGTA